MQFLIRHWLFSCVTAHLGRGVVCGLWSTIAVVLHYPDQMVNLLFER
jgi:hypothetical protein